MIFSNLFVPAHKSTNADKRKASIAKLDKSNPKHKRFLHELAFNDSDEGVTREALNKLDSFELWVKTAQTTEFAVLKKHAQEQVYAMLEQPSKVNDSYFTAFLTECNSKPIIEHVLFNSVRLLQDNALSLQMLEVLDNEQHTRRYFTNRASAELQLAMVQHIDDEKQLVRLKKHAKSDGVIAEIDSKLAHQRWLQAQPERVKQQATLINARMLALKDSNHYEHVVTEFVQLTHDFAEVKADFQYLAPEVAGELSEKFLGLKDKVTQQLSILEQEHQSQQALQATTNELSIIQQDVQEVEQQIQLLISEANDQADAQIKILSGAIESAQEALQVVQGNAQTAAHKQMTKQLNQQLLRMQTSLLALPKQLMIVSKVHAITNDLKGLSTTYASNDSLSNEDVSHINNVIDNAKQRFNALSSDVALPSSISRDFHQHIKHTKSLLNDYYSNLKALQRKCEGKIKVVNSLIKDGKFKPAIATFEHATKLIKRLHDDAPPRLSKAYEQTLGEVEKLKDWQSYIAQPRKPALVEQAQALINETLDNPYDRTELIKQLRLQWNSLGVLNTPEDVALNEAFDQAIETAFAPCRAFFTELDSIREHNLVKAKALIEEVNDLHSFEEAAALPAKMDALKKRFSKLGELDKSKVRGIKREFSQAMKPLQQRMHEYYAQNAEQKAQLIEQVKQLHDVDELKAATDASKAIQQKWKQIGFAGRAAENALWQSFRQENDVLFSKYHEHLSGKQEAQENTLKGIEQKVLEASNRLQEASSMSDLGFYSSFYAELEAKLSSLDKPAASKVKKQLQAMEQQYAARASALQQNKHKAEIETLMAYLQENNEDIQQEMLARLPSRYQSWIKGDFIGHELLQGLDRESLTLMASIVHNVSDSGLNAEQQNERKNLQLRLMAHKLEGNQPLLPEAILAAYVGLGPLPASDTTCAVMQDIMLQQA